MEKARFAAATEIPPPKRRLVNVDDVAALLSVSPSYVRRADDAGIMPRSVKMRRVKRWDLDLIHKWIDAGCPDCRRGWRP